MLKYLRQIWTLCQISPGFMFKAIAGGVFLFFLSNHFLKRPIYQRIYGKPDKQILQISQHDSFIDIPEQKIIPLNINGYDIEIQAIKRFETTTRIVYIDRYSSLGTWYRSREGAALYDAVVPQDISIATGLSGQNPHCFSFEHEYRCLLTEDTGWKTCPPEVFKDSDMDITNNHSIAANPTIQKGIDILKVGDIAHIEGYLMYWNGTGKLRYQRFESAITLGQISKELYGGQKSILCRQLLITKLTFDGYTFE